MSVNYFTLQLDTTAPASATIQLENGATSTANTTVQATISTPAGDVYQMKIWGDYDLAWGKTAGLLQPTATDTTEANAVYVTYQTSKALQLSSGDGNHTIYLKVRDDVYNEMATPVSASIYVDTTLPNVSVVAPTVTKVSKIALRNTASFQFTVDSVFVEYKVTVVGNPSDTQASATTILTTNGSSAMSGSAGNYAAQTPITCVINGTDLEVASSGDTVKTIKVFVKDDHGNWSV